MVDVTDATFIAVGLKIQKRILQKTAAAAAAAAGECVADWLAAD